MGEKTDKPRAATDKIPEEVKFYQWLIVARDSAAAKEGNYWYGYTMGIRAVIERFVKAHPTVWLYKMPKDDSEIVT